MSDLTVLRNRAYLGEVYFRGSYHAASHTPLIDLETFEMAHELLAERGSDQGACRSNSYDYLLSRLHFLPPVWQALRRGLGAGPGQDQVRVLRLLLAPALRKRRVLGRAPPGPRTRRRGHRRYR